MIITILKRLNCNGFHSNIYQFLAVYLPVEYVYRFENKVHLLLSSIQYSEEKIHLLRENIFLLTSVL